MGDKGRIHLHGLGRKIKLDNHIDGTGNVLGYASGFI